MTSKTTNRIAQLKAFQVTNSVTECPNRHLLEKTSVLESGPRGFSYSKWQCDECRQSFHVEDVMPHHCSKCEYDLCNNCTEKTVARQMEIPLRQVKVSGQVDDWLSDLTLHQVYKNDTEHDLEASYVFPIDPDAAIYQVVATIDQRRIEAVCKEKETAKQEYREAVTKGQFATLGREVHDDLFEMSVGRVPPGEEVEITVSYVCPLSFGFGDGFDSSCENLSTSTWKMSGIVPLTAFPRYQPKSETASNPHPSTSLNISNSVPYSLEVDLQVATSLPLHSLTIPSHQKRDVETKAKKEDLSKIGLGLADTIEKETIKEETIKEGDGNDQDREDRERSNITIEYTGEHTACIMASNLRMDRDFRFELAMKPVCPNMEFESLDSDGQPVDPCSKETPNIHSTQILGVPARMGVAPDSALKVDSQVADRFRLAGIIPIVVSSSESSRLDQPAEIVIVVDCSGSMNGNYWRSEPDPNSPIAQCAELLRLFAHSIPSTATFNVIRFGSTFQKLFTHPQPATSEYRDQAANLANILKADLGGTELLAPLQEIARTPVESGRVRQVFVLTDGGVSNTQQVLSQVNQDSHHARYFSIGIGEGCSHELVKGIADTGRGSSEFVSSGDLAPVVMKVLDRALRPAVTNWKVEFSHPGVRVATNKVYPIFMGQPGLVYFFGDKAAAEEVAQSGLKYTFKGKLGSKEIEVKGQVSSEEMKSSLTNHHLAAKTVITELERDSEYGLDTDRGSHLKKEVTSIGTVFNLASRETSFVGVETTKEPSTNKVITRNVPLLRPRDRPYYPPTRSRGVQDCRMSGALPSYDLGTTLYSGGLKGINTVGTSLRNANVQLSSNPPLRFPKGGAFCPSGQKRTNFFEKRASSYIAESRPSISSSINNIKLLDEEEDCDFSTDRIEISQTTKERSPTKRSLSSLLAQVGDDDLFQVNRHLLNEYGLTSGHSIWSNQPSEATDQEWVSAVVLAYLEQYLLKEKGVWQLVARRVRSCLIKRGRSELLTRAENMLKMDVSFCA